MNTFELIEFILHVIFIEIGGLIIICYMIIWMYKITHRNYDNIGSNNSNWGNNRSSEN